MDKTDKVEDPDQVKAKEYVEQLTELQLKAMNIAKQHLGMSFNLVKSVGFVEYKATSEKTETSVK
jgi:hypothetical protein